MVDDQEETSAINACEAKKQNNAHDQSPISKPPPEVQNPNKGVQMGGWQKSGQGNAHEQSTPVQIQQMRENNSIQKCEMGAWEKNGQGNARKQSLPVQIPQMVEKNPIQESEIGAWQTNGEGNAHEQSQQHAYLGASANPDPLPKGEKIEFFF